MEKAEGREVDLLNKKEKARRFLRTFFSIKKDVLASTSKGNTLAGVFGGIVEDPDILLGMPRLPILYQSLSDVESSVGMLDYEDDLNDSETQSPDWVDVDRSVLESWAGRMGLVLESVYQEVGMEDLEAVIDMSPKLAEYFQGGKKQPIRFLLEELRLELALHLYAERKCEEGKASLARYLNDFGDVVPTEPTVVVARTTWTDSSNGEYLGCFGGQHLIKLETAIAGDGIENQDSSFDPEVSLKIRGEEEDLLTMVHELLHQRHAEIVGQEAIFGYSPGVHFTMQEVLETSVVELWEKIQDLEERLGKENDLARVVVEGIAVVGEMVVIQRRIDDIRNEDPRRVEVLRQLLKERMRALREGRGSEKTKHYYEGSRVIMRKLYKRFGGENMPSILLAIDMPACYEIKTNSERYNRILEDPRLLPGLDVHPLVLASFSREQS